MSKITLSILAGSRDNFKKIAALCCLFFVIGGAFGQEITLFNFSGTTGYLATPATGWSSTGSEGGAYLKLSPGSVTSPEYQTYNNVVFQYDIASFSNGANPTNTKLIILSPTNTVITEFTLTSANSSTYITNQTINVGNIATNFKIKIEGFGNGQTSGVNTRGTRLRNYSLVGIAAASNDPLLGITGNVAHGSTCINTAATAITYTITNTGETAAENVTVVSSGANSADYVVSDLSSTTIAASGGTATYVVTFTPSTVGAKTATITVSSTTTGSNAPTNALTGTGINTSPTVATPTSAAITATSATLGGNITIAGCNPITERGIYYSTTNNFADGEGTKVSEIGTFSTGVFTTNTSGLFSGTTYYFKAFATSSAGSTYSVQGSFSTPTLPVTVPYSQDFEETTNEWTLDTEGTNKWSIGSATNNGGTKALYISNDGGTTNEYTTTSSQTGTNASVRVDLTGLTNATLSFDWKSNGEANSAGTTFYDFGEVYINTGASDILISNANEFYNTTVFALRTIDLTPYVGQIITLKFKWKNDSSVGSQPPFSVDNVSIVPYGLPAFTTAIATDITYNSATSGGTITNDGGSAITARGIVYATTASPTLLSNVVNSGSGNGTYTSNLTGLLSNTLYYVRAFVTNANGTSYGNQITFTTNSIVAPTALEESLVTSTGFTANWEAVTGATSYELDVSLYETFEIGGGLETLNEGFTTYTNATSFNDFTFSGTSNYTTGGTTGPNSVKFDDTNDNVVSPTLGGNATELIFWIKNNGWGSAAGNTFLVEGFNGTSWITVQDIPSNSVESTGTTFTYNSSSTPALPSNITQFRFTLSKTTGNVAFDDFSVTYNTSVPSLITGYNGLNVGNVTTYNVTGLDPETTYYYRVRAISGTDTSVNSNVITATTLAASASTTWTITSPDTTPAWTNGVPTASVNAIIAEDYNETATITAKNLTINTGKVLTIQPANTLTVAGDLTNEGSIIFQSDATGTASFAAYTGAAIAGLGTSTVERYIPANRAWRILTAPLTGTATNTIADNWQGTDGEGVLLFSPSTVNSIAMVGYTTGGNAPNIKKYSAGWQNITNLTTEPMFGAAATDTKAYLVFPTGASNSTNIVTGVDATTLRPKGQLITGDVTHNGLAANTFYALANPYASPINPVTLVSENPGQKLWLINPSMGTFGAYVTFDGTDWSIPTPTGNDAYIQSGQGFFVRSATATSFAIKESDKVVGSSNSWFAKNATTSTTNPDKIRVLLYKQMDSEWKLADGILSVNYADGSNDVDAMDTNKISNFNESIMFRNNTTNLSIEHRSLPLATEIQPLRLTGTTAIAYQLRVKTENYSNSLLIPVLEDTLNGTFTEIPADGSEIILPFTGTVATSAAPDNRFRIVYQTNLSNVNVNALVASVYPNPVINSKLNINLANNTSSADYTITNLLGQSIQAGKLVNTQNVITLNAAKQGFYILNITQEGKSFTTKIYVQ